MKRGLNKNQVTREASDFAESLIEQLNFLIDFCSKYDHGNFNYSKQLAKTVRILVHDTANSTSLLSLLKCKNTMKFNSTASFPKNAIFFLGLVFPVSIQRMTEDGSPYNEHVYLPSLSYNKEVYTKRVDFNTWWNQNIIISDTLTFSRKDMIKYMSNQDGGAHVDETVLEKYYKISKATASMFYTIDKPLSEDPYQQGEPFKYLHFAVVRQIAHELILSIKREFNLDVLYNGTNKYNLNGLNIKPTEFIIARGTQLEY
ncbi:hypothetical protein JHL18_00520 [Clostridium sp. YIM B02505]|uniref:Uncharacterized protein n=1 Tax=Clostridium yunnanense TaxID=2800325 RepID=A0ABS1EIF7_9CLOT|nr:hypothetical protein [Clostridium yunnanense]MBK1809132.1 hypothetical protein [Clostridium yunnanense]